MCARGALSLPSFSALSRRSMRFLPDAHECSLPSPKDTFRGSGSVVPHPWPTPSRLFWNLPWPTPYSEQTDKHTDLLFYIVYGSWTHPEEMSCPFRKLLAPFLAFFGRDRRRYKLLVCDYQGVMKPRRFVFQMKIVLGRGGQ